MSSHPSRPVASFCQSYPLIVRNLQRCWAACWCPSGSETVVLGRLQGRDRCRSYLVRRQCRRLPDYHLALRLTRSPRHQLRVFYRICYNRAPCSAAPRNGDGCTLYEPATNPNACQLKWPIMIQLKKYKTKGQLIELI